MDRVLKLKLAFREAEFAYRACKYYHQPNTILVCLKTPLQRPEFISIIAKLGYVELDQAGLSTYLISF